MNSEKLYETQMGGNKSIAVAELLMHKFLSMGTEQLRGESTKLNDKIIAIQRSKDHHKHRSALSVMQSQLHRMNMELKRRDSDAKRARYAITPSAK